MKITAYKHKDFQLTEQNQPFINEMLRHLQTVPNHLIQHLFAPGSYSIEPISSLSGYIHQNLSSFSPEDASFILSNLPRFYSIFLIKYQLQVDKTDIIYPIYNLYHTGANCHINVCINILSSMFHLITHLNSTILPHTSFSKILLKILCNAHSPVDIEPHLIFDILKHLNIDFTRDGEAAETFKSLYKLISNDIPLSELRKTLFYWDTADTFVDRCDKKLLPYQLFAKYNPKYLVLNTQDFNVINDITSNTLTKLEFKLKTGSYELFAFIVNSGGAHFISAFKIPGTTTFRIRNDMLPRIYDDEFRELSSMQLAVSCFVRLD